MATGAAPALDPEAGKKTETTTEPTEAQPATFKGRVVRMLTKIFAGREEYAGWRQ